MPNTVIAIRSSGTAAATPSLGVIANGELSINFADGILYYKTASNTLGSIRTTQPAGLTTEIQFNDAGSFGSNSGLTFNKSTGVVTAPRLNVSSESTFYGNFVIDNAAGIGGPDEGGEIKLKTASANTSLAAGTVSIDIYQNRLRIFETGGTNRGAFIDLSTAGAGVTTNLIASSGSVTSVAGATGAVSNNQLIAGIQSVSPTANITFDTVIVANNGLGRNLRIGDDVWLGDINNADTMSLRGAQNAANAYIVFGNADATALGRAGSGALTYGGNTLWHAGNDGAGSGLDADLLDGLNSTSFANAAFANTDFTTISATAGVYGNASFIPVTTLTANGRVSSITNTAIAISAAAITSGTLAVAQGGTGVTTSTGTGSVVLNTSPTLSTPTVNRIDWPLSGFAQPSLTTRSSGTKLTLYPSLSSTSVDYAVGIDGGVLWSSIPAANSTFSFKWYGGENEITSLRGDGLFTTFTANLIGTTASTSNTTGTLRVAGGVGVQGNVYSSNVFTLGDIVAGLADGPVLGGATNPIFAGIGNTNNFIQSYTVNYSNTANASADIVAYPNNGSDASGWIDMGITSNAFTQAAYSVTGRNEGYIFMSAPSGSGTSGNLVIATDSTGTSNSIEFYTGGFGKAKTLANVKITTQTTSTSNVTGQLQVVGGVGVRGNVATDGVIFPDGTRQTTAATGGATLGDILALSIALG